MGISNFTLSQDACEMMLKCNNCSSGSDIDEEAEQCFNCASKAFTKAASNQSPWLTPDFTTNEDKTMAKGKKKGY